VSRLAPRRPRLAIAGGALFLAAAALVTSGALSGVDRYAVSHLMPWLRPRHHAFVTLSGLTLPSLGGSPGKSLVELWTYPAAFVPSLLLVLAAARRLRADGAPRAALAWCALWVAGNGVELVGKLSVVRPDLFLGPVHVAAFDHSLPSGHTVRSLLVAGALAAAWRHGRLAFAWAAGVLPALVALGAHTPTDVVAGVFVALALAGWAPYGVASTRAASAATCDCSEPHTCSQSAKTPASATR
jgi:membrane-associated phospholipid phosphatase